MSSLEIARKRKELENNFQLEANVLNGQLTNTKAEFDKKMSELQKECPHIWDNGEESIQKFSGNSVCTICRKKMKNN